LPANGAFCADWMPAACRFVFCRFCLLPFALHRQRFAVSAFSLLPAVHLLPAVRGLRNAALRGFKFLPAGSAWVPGSAALGCLPASCLSFACLPAPFMVLPFAFTITSYAGWFWIWFACLGLVLIPHTLTPFCCTVAAYIWTSSPGSACHYITDSLILMPAAYYTATCL